LAQGSGKLQSLSPLKTLARGYCIALDSSNAMITDAGQLQLGQSLRVRLAKGEALTEVKQVRKP
jgi:exodeoxyribonuclease VII large subunit